MPSQKPVNILRTTRPRRWLLRTIESVRLFDCAWDQLRFVNPDETSPRERYYDYRSDLAVADMIIYGRLDSVTIYDNYIEENITLFYLMVRRDEIPLEHPEDPTPDR